MRKFLCKILIFFLPAIIVFSVLITTYIILDPFMVIRSYENYYAENQKRFDNKADLAINRDLVGTKTFLYNTNKKHIKYNSFILGNSRSMFYNISDWQKHLPADAVCFHYNAFGESLWALSKKIEFLDKHNVDLKNVLLILDYATLIKEKPLNGHLFMITPILADNDNLVKFHTTFFQSFTNPKFLLAYFHLLITKEHKPYMAKEGLNKIYISYDVLTNEYRWNAQDSLLNAGQYYTPEIRKRFYERDTIETISPVVINMSQIEILEKISNILRKHNTNYRVIINPLYDQKKLNPLDLMKLQEIFGTENVFDFSGINSITNDFQNYYEDVHYRPKAANEVLDKIYE